MKSDVGSRRRDVFNPERNADQSRTKRWRWNEGRSGARLVHVHTQRSWIGFREDIDSSRSQRVKLLSRCDIPASRLLVACNLIAHTWRPSQHPLPGVFSLLVCASVCLSACAHHVQETEDVCFSAQRYRRQLEIFYSCRLHVCCPSVPVCACVCVLELVSRLWVVREHYEFDMIQYSLKTCMFVCVHSKNIHLIQPKNLSEGCPP